MLSNCTLKIQQIFGENQNYLSLIRPSRMSVWAYYVTFVKKKYLSLRWNKSASKEVYLTLIAYIIVFTNKKLFRFGLAESPSCAFCQTEVESVEHLLFSCRVSSSFWKHVLSWLRDNNVSVDNLKEEDVIFGKFDIAEDFLLFNHILLLGKFYIYSRKYQNGIPSLQGFIARTRRIYNIELHIARKRDKLNNHFRKWEKLISVFT